MLVFVGKVALVVGPIEVGILTVLVIFSAIGLLDYKLIVSLVVVELPLAALFYYIFGERRRSKIREAIDRLQMAKEYGHLRLHLYTKFPRPFTIYWTFVENSRKKHAYDAPRYLWELGEWGFLPTVRHRNETEMVEYFKNKDITVENRDPTPEELLSN